MTTSTFEVRRCNSCGLRYPLPVTDTAPTKRCPACMGETRVILRRDLITETKPILPKSQSHKRGNAILLDNVRSAWNVGSIFRTADGFGYSHAYLCGITPSPDNDAVKKTSLGAEDSIAWTSHADAVVLVEKLKSEGTKIIALEEHENSVSLEEISRYTPNRQSVLIVGNEIAGVDPHLLDLCDQIYHISMYGEKKSFNVAIAFGIAAFALSAH